MTERETSEEITQTLKKQKTDYKTLDEMAPTSEEKMSFLTKNGGPLHGVVFREKGNGQIIASMRIELKVGECPNTRVGFFIFRFRDADHLKKWNSMWETFMFLDYKLPLPLDKFKPYFFGTDGEDDVLFIEHISESEECLESLSNGLTGIITIPNEIIIESSISYLRDSFDGFGIKLLSVPTTFLKKHSIFMDVGKMISGLGDIRITNEEKA
jgi:hypothetical protein